MQVIASRPLTLDGSATIIDKAASDCGEVHYYPIGNDRLIVAGRDVYQGRYADNGQPVTDRRLWATARRLMRTVDTHNRAALDAARDASIDRECDRLEQLDKALAGTRGTYVDPNTY